MGAQYWRGKYRYYRLSALIYLCIAVVHGVLAISAADEPHALGLMIALCIFEAALSGFYFALMTQAQAMREVLL